MTSELIWYPVERGPGFCCCAPLGACLLADIARIAITSVMISKEFNKPSSHLDKAGHFRKEDRRVKV
jgi:hypothetical protein